MIFFLPFLGWHFALVECLEVRATVVRTLVPAWQVEPSQPKMLNVPDDVLQKLPKQVGRILFFILHKLLCMIICFILITE